MWTPWRFSCQYSEYSHTCRMNAKSPGKSALSHSLIAFSVSSVG